MTFRLTDDDADVYRGYIQNILPDCRSAEVYVEKLCKRYVNDAIFAWEAAA